MYKLSSYKCYIHWGVAPYPRKLTEEFYESTASYTIGLLNLSAKF